MKALIFFLFLYQVFTIQTFTTEKEHSNFGLFRFAREKVMEVREDVIIVGRKTEKVGHWPKNATESILSVNFNCMANKTEIFLDSFGENKTFVERVAHINSEFIWKTFDGCRNKYKDLEGEQASMPIVNFLDAIFYLCVIGFCFCFCYKRKKEKNLEEEFTEILNKKNE